MVTLSLPTGFSARWVIGRHLMNLRGHSITFGVTMLALIVIVLTLGIVLVGLNRSENMNPTGLQQSRGTAQSRPSTPIVVYKSPTSVPRETVDAVQAEQARPSTPRVTYKSPA